jgi:hypothetical protein
MKDKEVCKLSIFPLTFENLNPKYHSREKRHILEKKSNYEQENNRISTDLLTNRKQSNSYKHNINIRSSKKKIEI